MDGESLDEEGAVDEPTLDNIPPTTPVRSVRRRWLRLLGVVGAASVACSLVSVAGIFALGISYEDEVEHADILKDVPRPTVTPPEEGPYNYLILGSDSRSPDPKNVADPNGARSDTIMVLHVSKGLKTAFVVSIPRDSYVNVPAAGAWPGGNNKINAAFAFGGASLTAKTVYDLTMVRFDGAIIVNFKGINDMVSVVGTVHVCIPYAVRSTFSRTVWPAGCHDMGPTETEEFMRQRMGVPGGDFGRIYDQQLVVKALAKKIAATGMLTHPLMLDSLIRTAASSLTLDSGTELVDLASRLKGIDPESISFATAPHLRTMDTDAGSSVELDMPGVRELFQALIADTWPEWLARHPQKVPSG